MFRFLRLRWTLIAVLVVTFALPGSSQQNSPEVPPPTIRVTTRMVLVDVVVTDKHGNAVSGLHPEDFAIEENGKAQKIVTLTVPAASTAAPSLPPGIYSNRPQFRSPGGPITVMLLDAVNTEFSDQGYARRQMLSFVRDQYRPGQRMAIFTLTGSLNVLQDFTSDPQILYAALQRFQPQSQQFASSGQGTSSTLNSPATGSVAANIEASTAPASDVVSTLRSGTAQEVAAMQTAMQSFEGAQVVYAEEQRTVLTLQALNSLGRILGGLPGRKNVIWVAGNLPFSLIPENRDVTEAELTEDLLTRDQHTLSQHVAGNYAETFRTGHADQIRETAARLASAQVAIYPVDARGLSISTSSDSLEIMREMARETGGRAYVNQNEIKLGVQRAFQDTDATYTLGYYPENKKWDGKYRRIKVKIKRDGIELQHRRGYYAFDPSQLKGYNPQQEVTAALNDVVPSTLVSFTAQIRPPNANTTPGKVGVDFLVDANTLSAQETSGGKRLNFAYYVTVFSPQGKMVAQRRQKVDRSFAEDVYKQIIEKGILLHMDIDPQPGNNQVRLAVQDNQTGLVGTIDAPLTQ
jgi:VWFA-related protein